jgi:hypothetical protein
MTISLSWHPSEKPAKEHMIETASSFLERMGWHEHQAVVLAHNDTEHQHLHIILNRIHPESGLVHDDAFSHNRAQRWREDYERVHGQIRSLEVAERHQHKHHDFARDARAVQDRYAELEAVATRTLEQMERDQLARRHQQEREAFLESRHQQFRQARETAYREVRDAYRQRWVEHYREAAELRAAARRNRDSIAQRALHFARQGQFPHAWQAVTDRDAFTRAVEHGIAERRQELRAGQRAEARQRQDEACNHLFDQRADAFAAIKQRQKQERAELKELRSARAEGRLLEPQRLAELINEPVSALQTHVQETHKKELDHQQIHILRPEPTREGPPRDLTAAAKAPSRGFADGLAGGIGKLAEIASDIMASFLSPETEQQRLAREARAQAEAAAEPERQAAAEAMQLQERQQAYEQQQRIIANEQIDAYFAQHGERLRREEDERRRDKRRERER